MKTLVFANQKGGVGKSAIGTQFSYHCVRSKLKVLYLDLDHQMNSTRAIKKSGFADSASFTTSQLLGGSYGELPLSDFVIVEGDDVLSTLERQPDAHNAMVNHLKIFLHSVSDRFDICLMDTNPNPDIRYAAAIINSNYVLSPVELKQEAIDGIVSLLSHTRYGIRKIKAVLNKDLELIGILPNLVEATPFQKDNFKQIVQSFSDLLIRLDGEGGFAFIPRRSSIAEAQAQGDFLGDMKKSAARDAWRSIKPTFDVIISRMELEGEGTSHGS